jgi:hypothetical protein
MHMPTVLKIYGLRFFFYSKEESRMHIHVEIQGEGAKVWMDTFEVAFHSKGLSKKDLSNIVKLVRKYEKEIKQAWFEHFGRN